VLPSRPGRGTIDIIGNKNVCLSNQEEIRQDLQDLQDRNRKIILLILSKTCLLVISNNVYLI
jgi:hypothetical protein